MSSTISRYNFKAIAPIPTADKLVDVILSKTNRKTPTEIRANFKISRIRRFYMRKIKYTQTTTNEKLQAIIDGFPKLDDIHPFYADLMNVLYDRDHYKLALGHVNKARGIVDKIANDYVKLMKYADSLYRSKMLKRAALGRMATLIKKLKPSLGYLEEVRKHLARLPSIDTNTRTLLITGYPNVGKSSFLNNVTNADVDVQNYPFTTQSLFVGHTEYKYTDWQIIDTPGLLDRPISERNTIEMQAITALAHLNACILYFIDISQQCGYTIEQQIKLFKSIRKLFYTVDPETDEAVVSKPIVIVLTKIDTTPYEDLTKEEQTLITKTAEESKAYVVKMSNIDGTGIGEVKQTACDILLDHRLTQKAKNPKKAESILNRIYVATPKKMDTKERPPHIPKTVLKEVKRPEGKPTVLEMQVEKGGAGVWSYPYQEDLILEDPEWKYDNIPVFFSGHNVADFYDPDIEEKLNELEKEEDYIRSIEDAEVPDMPTEMEERMIRSYQEVQSKIKLKRGIHSSKAEKRVIKKTITAEDAEKSIKRKVDDKAAEIVQRETRKRRTLFDIMGVNKKRRKIGDDEDMEVDGEEPKSVHMEIDKDNPDLRRKMKERKIQFVISRMEGADPKKFSTKIQDQSMDRVRHKIEKRLKKTENVNFADRVQITKMPKHLYSGKRGNGKTDRR
jgi:nucleolar GTP-binding protein